MEKIIVPEEYIIFLNSIRKDEGGELHRNSNETDITTGSGIYRAKHPDVKIFKYIDSVANSIGITKPSSKWTKEEINLVNSKLDIEQLNIFAYIFYKEYLQGAMLNMFPSEDLIEAMGNLFVNSPKGAWKAVQYMIKIAFDRGMLKGLQSTDISIIDGCPGKKTKLGLDSIKLLDAGFKEACRAYLIFGMTLFYIDIATDKMNTSMPGADEHLKYLKGWTHNRMLGLMSK